MATTGTATATKKSTSKAKATKVDTPSTVETATGDDSGALASDLAAARAEIVDLKEQVSALTPEPEPEPEPLTTDQKLDMLCHSLRATFLRSGRPAKLSELHECLTKLGC